MSSSCSEQGGEKHGYWQESFAVLTSKKVRNSPLKQEGVRSTVGNEAFELLSSSNEFASE